MLAARLLAASCACATAAALAACGSSKKTGTTNGAPGERAPVLGFAVSATPATSDDALPRDVADTMMGLANPEVLAADVRAARRVIREGAWLLPAANGEACLVRLAYSLVAPRGSIPPYARHVCLPEQLAQEGRLLEAESFATPEKPNPNARVVGIVPNGVSSVTFRSRGGQHTVVQTTRNAYEAIVIEPVELAFVSREGGKTTRHSFGIVPR